MASDERFPLDGRAGTGAIDPLDEPFMQRSALILGQAPVRGLA